MTRRLRDSPGFTLVEIMLVMVIALMLLTATVTIFTKMIAHGKTQDQRNDTAERARRGLDVQARQLRNLAKRLNNNPVIDTVAGDELIFQTSDPSRTWIRYCYDSSLGQTRGRVWEQAQALPVGTTSSPVTAAMHSTCGTTSGWSRTTLVADYVVNKLPGRDVPLFTYRCIDGGTGCTGGASTFDRIVGVNATILVDTTPNKLPGELRVSSGVYLRNQNQAPTAAISWQSAGPRTVIVNASGSEDFEGRTLSYFWFIGTMPTSIQCNAQDKTVSGTVTTLWGGTLMGEGITLTYQWPGTSPATGSAQTVGLVACDPGDRYGYTTTSVTIP